MSKAEHNQLMTKNQFSPGPDSIHMEKSVNLTDGEEQNCKNQFSPAPDSIHLDRSVNSTDGEEQNCKKGRRKSGFKKHRAGKKQKRKYKPYHKLTSAERVKVDERISRRSSLRRSYLHSCGVPLAPLNTTQFLVNDSIEASSLLKKWKDREDLADAKKRRDPSDAKKSEDEEYSADASPASKYDDDTDEYQDDFQEVWSHYYEHMSHEILADWYYNLEEEVRQMKEHLVVEQKIAVFEDTVRRYKGEIAALEEVHEKLIKMVKYLPCKDELAKILESYGDRYRHLKEDDSPSQNEIVHFEKYAHSEENYSSSDDEKVSYAKYPHSEEDFSPSDDEKVINATEDLPLDLNDSSSKDEKVSFEHYPHSGGDFSSSGDEKVINATEDLPLESNESPSKDEPSKIITDFSIEDAEVINEKDRDLEEKRESEDA